MGYVEALCISTKKGTVKKEIDSVQFLKEWGLEGDAHGGDWHRQVSLLAGESIDNVKTQMPSLTRGAFAENVITREIELAQLEIGSRLKLGENILLEITQIGKECHNGCAIKTITGDCIMPREGLFARVLEGGMVRPGTSISIV